MKNKKTIYFLLPVVIGIWALIGFKIFNYKNDDNNSFGTLENKNNDNNTESLNENYNLLLNYPDPFLKRKRSYRAVNSNSSVNNTSSNKTSNRKTGNNKPVAKESSWPEIEYLGRVKNDHDSRELAFIIIDKKEKLIEPGIIINDVKILAIEGKKITVEFNNEKREIFKKKS